MRVHCLKKVKSCIFSCLLKILTSVHLFRAPMAERALMGLIISLVNALQDTQATNAKRVSEMCYNV